MATSIDTSVDVVQLLISMGAATAVVTLTLVCGSLGMYAMARQMARRESSERSFNEKELMTNFYSWFLTWWLFVKESYLAARTIVDDIARQILGYPVTAIVVFVVFIVSVTARVFQSNNGTAFASDAYTCTVNPVNFIFLALFNVIRLVGATLQPLWNGAVIRVPNVAVLGVLFDLLGMGPALIATAAFNLLSTAAYFALANVQWLTSGNLLETQPNFVPTGVALGNTIATAEIFFTQICQSLFSVTVVPFFASFGTVNATIAPNAQRLHASALALATLASQTPIPREIDTDAMLPWARVDVYALPVVARAHEWLGDGIMLDPLAVRPLVVDEVSNARLTNFPVLFDMAANVPLAVAQDLIRPIKGFADALGVVADLKPNAAEAFEMARPSFNVSLGRIINTTIESGRFVDVVVGNYYNFIVGASENVTGYGTLVGVAPANQVLPFPFGPERPPFFGEAFARTLTLPLVAAKITLNIAFNIDRVVSKYDGQLILRWDEFYNAANAMVAAYCRPFEWVGKFFHAVAADVVGVEPVCPAATVDILCAQQPVCTSDVDCSAPTEHCALAQGRCIANDGCALVEDGTLCSLVTNVTSDEVDAEDICALGQCQMGTCVLSSRDRYWCSCTCTYEGTNVCASLVNGGNVPPGSAASEGCALDTIGRALETLCCFATRLVKGFWRLVKNAAEVSTGTLYTIVATFVDPTNTRCEPPIDSKDATYCALPRYGRSTFWLTAPFRFAQFYWGDRGQGQCADALCALDTCDSTADCADATPEGQWTCDQRIGRCFVQCVNTSYADVPCAFVKGVGSPTTCAVSTCESAAAVCTVNVVDTFACDCGCYDPDTAPNEFRETLNVFVDAFDCVGAALEATIGPPARGIRTLIEAVVRTVGEVILLIIDLFIHLDHVFAGDAQISMDALYAAVQRFADAASDFVVAFSLKTGSRTAHPHTPALRFGDCAADLPQQTYAIFEATLRGIIDSTAELYTAITNAQFDRLLAAGLKLTSRLDQAITRVQNTWEDLMCIVFQAVPSSVTCPASPGVVARSSLVRVATFLGAIFTETVRVPVKSIERSLQLIGAIASGNQQNIATAFSAWLVLIIEWIVDLIAEFIRLTGALFGCFVDKALQTVFTEIADDLLSLISVLEQAIADVLQGLFLAIGAMIGFFAGNFDSLFEFFEFVLTRVFSMLTGLLGPTIGCAINEIVCFFEAGGITGMQYCWIPAKDYTRPSFLGQPPKTFPGSPISKEYERFTGETTPIFKNTICQLDTIWVCGPLRDVTCFFGDDPPGTFCCPCGEEKCNLRAKRKRTTPVVVTNGDDDTTSSSSSPRARVRDVFPELVAMPVHAIGVSNPCLGVMWQYADAEWPPTRMNTDDDDGSAVVVELCSYILRTTAERRLNGATILEAPIPSGLDSVATIIGYVAYLFNDVSARVEHLTADFGDRLYTDETPVEKRNFHQRTVAGRLARTLVDDLGVHSIFHSRPERVRRLGRISLDAVLLYRQRVEARAQNRDRHDRIANVLRTFDMSVISVDVDAPALWNHYVSSAHKRTVIPNEYTWQYVASSLFRARSTHAAYHRARIFSTTAFGDYSSAAAAASTRIRVSSSAHQRHRDPHVDTTYQFADTTTTRARSLPDWYRARVRRAQQRSVFLLRSAVAVHGSDGLVALSESDVDHDVVGRATVTSIVPLTAQGSEPVVSIFSPFVCPSAQAVCIDCSWFDRLSWAFQDTFVGWANYYRGQYLRETIAQLGTSAASLALFASEGRYNNDTFLTNPRTVPFIVDSLRNVTFFWQLNYTQLLANLNDESSAATSGQLFPPNSPLIDTYIDDQEAASSARDRGSTNLATVALGDRFSPSGDGGRQLVTRGENVTGVIFETLVNDVFVFEQFIEQFVFCNYSFGHYCKVNPVTGERLLGNGLLSGIVNWLLIVFVLLFLVAAVPWCVGCWYVVRILLAFATVLSLAYAYGASPLCYSPGVVAAGYVALPNVLTAFTLWPGLPACIYDDLFSLYSQAPPPYFPRFVELVRRDDVRVNNYNSQCSLSRRNAPDELSCTSESSMIDGLDSFFYFLEQTWPGINERIVDSDVGTLFPFLAEAAGAHTAAKNAAEPLAFACATWGLWDIVAAFFVLVFAAIGLGVVIIIVYAILWFLALLLFATVLMLWEIFVQIENGYIHSFTYNEFVSQRDGQILVYATVPMTGPFV